MRFSDSLTLMRLAFAPIFFLLYSIPIWTEKFAALSVFVVVPLLILAELTDAFDGYFARKNGCVSDFGKIFDPFADVVLHLTTFVCFTSRGFFAESGAYLPLFLFLPIFYREFAMIFLRMVAAKNGIAIAARKGGKIKTFFYVVAEFFALFIECLLRLSILDVQNRNFLLLKWISFALFCLCAVAAILSLADYIFAFKSAFFGGKND